MSRTCIQTTDLQACIHSDGRRQDGRSTEQTNEQKENIQTDRVTNNIYKNMHTGKTHGRTDT